MKLKIAIVVHGRFDAFDLAKACIERGHDLTLFTNYPKCVVEQFGISAKHVRAFWLHGLLSRLIVILGRYGFPSGEGLLHQMYGKWAAGRLAKETWDIVDTWSGASEEVLRTIKDRGALTFLVRGSSHIDTQHHILMEEEQRTGMQLVKPSRWMIAREKREYELAAHIRVLSTFARQSFILEGVSADKVALIPSAVPVNNFHVDQKIVAERCKRILAKRPIRILYVGTLCFRKGLYDLAAIIQKLHGEHFEFRLVGPALREAFPLLEAMQSYAKIDRKLPQAQLPSIYSWADLFIFPTLEDGYPAVLAQAYASALPILTTTNCSGPDLIKTGETGWVLPIRSPEAFVDRLIWCDSHRDELADMVCKVYADSHARKWSDVVCDIERFYQQRQTAAK